MSFAKLCEMYGSDKYQGHRYDALYERILAPYRCLPRPVRLLEIGIAKGASLRVWMNYFKPLAFVRPNIPSIFAVDISPESVAAAPSGVTTFCGDQGDPVFLDKVVQESGGQFDIVIDDGAHSMWGQCVSFDKLWPEVLPGGVYVIEDMESSMRRAAQREAKAKGIQVTLAAVFAQIRSQMKRKAPRPVRPLYTFCGEAVAIEKPYEST